MEHLNNYTKQQALNLGSNEKRKVIKNSLQESKIKAVNSKGYAYLKVAQSDKLIKQYFDGKNDADAPQTPNKDAEKQEDKAPQKQAKKLVKNSDTDKQAEELTTLLTSILANQSANLDEDAVRELVKDEVKRQTNGVKRIKVDFENKDVETPEVSSTRENFEYMVADLVAGNNTLLSGPTGSGKTVLAHELAKACGVNEDNIYVVSCEPFTFKGDFWGAYKSADDYVQGAFEKAAKDVQNGKQAAVIIDEITKLDPECAGTLNAPLSHNKQRRQFFTTGRGEKLEITDVFIVATTNTWGKGFDAQYVGNQQQDLSLLNRFNSSKYYVGYDKELEKSLVDEDVFRRLDGIREKMLDHKIQHSITLRDMINADLAKQAGKPLEKTVECLTADWTADERAKVGI